MTTTATRWTWAGLLLVAGLALFTDVNRFDFPYGEKSMFPYIKGAEDLKQPFLGAKAILQGENPYHTVDPALALPNGWNQTYPPTMLALYVPLVWASHGDFERGAKIFFVLNLLAIALTAAVVAALLRSLERGQRAAPFFVVAATVLALSPSGQFTLDRAQCEFLTAALAWAAVWSYVARRPALAMFTGVLAVGLKGYAVILVLGLGVLLLLRRRWRAVLAGGAAALALNTLPILRLLPDAPAAYRKLVPFHATYYNHSFAHVAYQLDPSLLGAGRWTLVAIGLAASVAAWLNLRRHTEDEIAWTVLFACSSLGVMVGMAEVSAPYALDLVLPGGLALLGCLPHFTRILRLGAGRHALAVALLASLAAMVLYRTSDESFTLAGLGLTGLLVVCGAVGLLGLLRRKTPGAQQPELVVVDPGGADQQRGPRREGDVG